MLGQLRKGYGKIVCSWKSSELKSTKSCEKAPRPQPNLIFAQFSVVYIFNWMLDQLKKDCKEIIYSWKNSELKSAEPCEKKMEKISPLTQFSVRVILSRIYIQLDARPIKKDCKK